MMAWLWGKLSGWLALAAAVLALLVGIKRAGKAEGAAEVKTDTLQRQTANMEKAHEAARAVDRLPDGAAVRELRRKWTRDDTH